MGLRRLPRAIKAKNMPEDWTPNSGSLCVITGEPTKSKTNGSFVSREGKVIIKTAKTILQRNAMVKSNEGLESMKKSGVVPEKHESYKLTDFSIPTKEVIRVYIAREDINEKTNLPELYVAAPADTAIAVNEEKDEVKQGDSNESKL